MYNINMRYFTLSILKIKIIIIIQQNYFIKILEDREKAEVTEPEL